VTFVASATDDVDPNPTVICTPASATVFAIRDTAVSCVATDHSGNSATATFNVHVKGAAEQLADLERAVAGVGRGRSLVDKVRAAEAYLRRHAIGPTIRTLKAFINEVNAQAGKSIPRDLAAGLVATATRIAHVLGDRSC
jgi:oligoribonuclease (3'-5' exoribonuclease)